MLLAHTTDSVTGNLVAISDELNSPSVYLELQKEPNVSLTVRLIGLGVGGVLMIAGTWAAVDIQRKRRQGSGLA